MDSFLVNRSGAVESPNIDWDAFEKVEEGWNRDCRENWPRFLRACAIELLERLPPEAGTWIAEADRYEQGELSETEIADARNRAWRFYNERKVSAGQPELCGLTVAMYCILPRKADWTREEYTETCNFIECCIAAGMSNETLNRLLGEHFPSAFAPRPWWKFW